MLIFFISFSILFKYKTTCKRTLDTTSYYSLFARQMENTAHLQDEVTLEDLVDHHWDLYFATSVATGPFYPTGIKQLI